PNRKHRTDAQVQAIEDDADADVNRECHTANDRCIEKLKRGEYTASRFYDCFPTSEQIFEYADKLVEQNPTLLTKEAISTTVHNKTIYAYKLIGGVAKTKSLYFQSPIHAREWAAGSSNLFALSSILDDIVQGRLTAADSYKLPTQPVVTTRARRWVPSELRSGRSTTTSTARTRSL
ncbi:hypothetical protein AaE_001607, partial [Aphanomyces astaci]